MSLISLWSVSKEGLPVQCYRLWSLPGLLGEICAVFSYLVPCYDTSSMVPIGKDYKIISAVRPPALSFIYFSHPEEEHFAEEPDDTISLLRDAFHGE